VRYDGSSVWKCETFTRAAPSLATVTTVRANDAATNASVAYTGVGFKPRRIEFFAAINGTRMATLAGVWDNGTHSCLYDSEAVAGSYGTSTANCIIIDEETGVKAQSATVASADADGFTLSWVRVGTTSAGNIDITAKCFR